MTADVVPLHPRERPFDQPPWGPKPHHYCPSCGQCPGISMDLKTWELVIRRHQRWIDGKPEYCTGEGSRAE